MSNKSKIKIERLNGVLTATFPNGKVMTSDAPGYSKLYLEVNDYRKANNLPYGIEVLPSAKVKPGKENTTSKAQPKKAAEVTHDVEIGTIDRTLKPPTGINACYQQIFKKCFDCSGYNAAEVTHCTSKDCPLYEYRNAAQSTLNSNDFLTLVKSLKGPKLLYTKEQLNDVSQKPEVTMVQLKEAKIIAKKIKKESNDSDDIEFTAPEEIKIRRGKSGKKSKKLMKKDRG
jgi:hypothetical protein